jgi:hypothetical protein
VVVGTIPIVNGTELASAAPAKATACVVAAGLGVAVVFEGLRTLFACQLELSVSRRKTKKNRSDTKEANREKRKGGGDVLIKHMHNAISDDDVGDDYLSRVHENLPILNKNIYFTP